MNTREFIEGMTSRLVAAGFTADEQRIGALMAEMYAALKLVGNPLAAMAIRTTFSKALALLTDGKETTAARVSEAADLIFDSTMAYAKEKVAALRQSSEGKGVPTVMSAELLDEDRPVDPKDI